MVEITVELGLFISLLFNLSKVFTSHQKKLAMKKYVVEFLGTFFLVNGAIFGGAIGASVALMVMVYAGGHISGAHFNPAVTIAMLIRKKITSSEVPGYMIAQFLAAVVSVLMINYVFDKQGYAVSCDVFPKDALQIGLAELIGTFALAYVVLHVATAKGTAGNSFYGIAIGGTVLAMALSVGTISGGVFNPAVGLGLSVYKAVCWSVLWLYFIAQALGGVLAALVFRYVNGADDIVESIPEEKGTKT
jgi:aquaporin Z